MSARPAVDLDRVLVRAAWPEDKRIASGKARRHYIEVHEVARRARDELMRVIGDEDIPRPPRAVVVRLIQAFSWASRTLWLAAQAVCDVEDLPEEGRDEGIVWEVRL